MKKLLTVILLTFMTTTCISCNNNDTHIVSTPHKTYTEVQTSVEEKIPAVYITATGEKYHKENRRYLKYTKCKTSLTDAKDSGFTPCSVCNP